MEDAFASKEEPLQSCESPVSLFQLIESVWGGDNSQPLHRFCSLMRKMKAKSFVQEELLANQELADEQEMVAKCFRSPVDTVATRLTFFSQWADAPLTDENILGYAVVVKIRCPDGKIKTHLLEAVVRPPSVVLLDAAKPFIKPITNYYVHNVRAFRTCVGTKRHPQIFTITGSFFTQQNQITSVCAHACLRMAMNSSPFVKCGKITNKQINDILGADTYGQGLSQNQIVAVVRNLGCQCHSANFSNETGVEYDHFMYPSLESCFPTILGIEYWDRREQRVAGHVVTVLGHTINSDRWEPEAVRGYGGYPLKPYIPTAEWCDHYIISDDNFGMYSTLPTDAIRNYLVPAKNPNRHASMAVSIVPEDVTMPGYIAEQFAVDKATKLINTVRLQVPNVWHERLREKSDGLVCRTLLQTKRNYTSFVKHHAAQLTAEQQSCFDSLSEYVWVSEVSLPDIYTANKHKLGDVVLRADATRQESSAGRSLALAWFPGFIQIGCHPNVSPWAIGTHVPLIRSTENPLLEW